MCRSIRQLRNPERPASDDEIREAALQFVRKISGYRKPSRVNDDVFNQAVDDVAAVSRVLLSSLQVRGAASPQTIAATGRAPCEIGHS